jgi:hypothetical protein
MKWILGMMLATLAATVTVNVLLLGYGGTPHDPVGRLSPIAYLPAPAHAHPAVSSSRNADD